MMWKQTYNKTHILPKSGQRVLCICRNKVQRILPYWPWLLNILGVKYWRELDWHPEETKRMYIRELGTEKLLRIDEVPKCLMDASEEVSDYMEMRGLDVFGNLRRVL